MSRLIPTSTAGNRNSKIRRHSDRGTLQAGRCPRGAGPSWRWGLLLLAAMFWMVGSSASAALFYWDPGSTPTTPSGGTGTWSTNGTSVWSNLTSDFPWTDTTGVNVAVFENTAGIVTLSGTDVANGVTFATSGYTLTGGTLALGGATPTVSVGTGLSATIGSAVTTLTGLYQTGGGTLTLGGSLNLVGSAINNSGNTPGLMLQTSGSTTNINAGTDTISSISMGWNHTAQTLNISGTADITLTDTTDALAMGQNTNVSSPVVNQSGGTLSFSAGGFMTLGKWDGGTAEYNILNGTLNAVNIYMGGDPQSTQTGRGILNQSGGTVNVSGTTVLGTVNEIQGAGGGVVSWGTLYLTGGHYNQTAGNVVAGNTAANTGSVGVITIAGGNLNVTAGNIVLANAGACASGILNLRTGGVASANAVVTGNAAGTSIVNFNGGTLRADSNSGAAFLQGLSQANVFSGGAVIDSNGQNITIAQALLAPAGNGIATIPVATGGAGYIGTPIVEITGGGGTGATAVATMAGGAITGITITNSGTGYTSSPTITLVGGGIPGTAATTGAVTLNSGNASGGLTKQGNGALILSGADTYTGTTRVSGGSLILNGAAAGTLATSGITVSSGGTFGFTTGSAAALTLPGTLSLGGGTLDFDIGGAGTNDVINAGTLSLTANTNTMFNFVGAIRNGSTYTLATYGSLNNPGAFTLGGQTIGRLTLDPVVGATSITLTPSLAQGVWNSSSGGNWSSGPWLNYTPSVAGDAALFGTSPGLTSSGTIAVNVPESVGYMTFDNTTASYTIGTLGSGNLTLDNGTASAMISVLDGGSHTIAESMVLNSNLIVATDSTATLTIAGALSGSGRSLTKTDAGTLILSGVNSFDGGTAIVAGTIRIGNAGAPRAGQRDLHRLGGDFGFRWQRPVHRLFDFGGRKRTGHRQWQCGDVDGQRQRQPKASAAQFRTVPAAAWLWRSSAVPKS